MVPPKVAGRAPRLTILARKAFGPGPYGPVSTTSVAAPPPGTAASPASMASLPIAATCCQPWGRRSFQPGPTAQPAVVPSTAAVLTGAMPLATLTVATWAMPATVAAKTTSEAAHPAGTASTRRLVWRPTRHLPAAQRLAANPAGTTMTEHNAAPAAACHSDG